LLICHEYALDRGENWKKLSLLIFGDYSRGKTTFSTILVKEFLKHSQFFTAAYVTAKDLYISAKSHEHVVDFKYLAGVDILIVDDLGKEPSKEDLFFNSFISMLDDLIRVRRGSRATILISNNQREKLATQYGMNFEMMFQNDFLEISFKGYPILGKPSG
jgi:DNA replication protein DnaC